jgi:hypothetical protein
MKSNKLYKNKKLSLCVLNLRTHELIFFSSIRKTAQFIKISSSYLTKSMKNNGYFINRNYHITKKSQFL